MGKLDFKDPLFGLDYTIDNVHSLDVDGHLFPPLDLSCPINNPYRKYTFRHWLFDHWEGFKEWKVKQLVELANWMADYRAKIIFRGTKVTED